MQDLRIDPEFRDKIPPLTDAEFEQLKENILNDGEVYEPICVWNETIIDGHNRWKIVQEHPEIPYRIKEMDFSDKWAAFDWMYKKQLGRRNLTEEQRTYMIGKMYEARKKAHGASDGFRGNQSVSSQNGNLPKPLRTGETIAQELGIGYGTVMRAADFAKGTDALRQESPEAADIVLKGGSGATKGNIQDLSKKSSDEVKDFAESVISGEIKEKRKPKPKPVGNTKEMRERMKLADEVIAEMYSPEIKEFTIEMLESDIELNGMEYVSVLRNTLADHGTMLVGDNRERVGKKIDSIIEEIQKIRRLVE